MYMYMYMHMYMHTKTYMYHIWPYSCGSPHHINQKGLEVLCRFRLPELVSLPPPLLLLGRPAQLHLPLPLLEASLDTLLPG